MRRADFLIESVQAHGDSTECLIWPYAMIPEGYGSVSYEGRQQGVHRVAYRHFVGPIPGGMVIDHLCRNRACYNPKCLEPVTNGENIRRGRLGDATTNPRAAQLRAKANCPSGHPYPPRKEGAKQRICPECARRWRRESYHRRKESQTQQLQHDDATEALVAPRGRATPDEPH